MSIITFSIIGAILHAPWWYWMSLSILTIINVICICIND